MTELDLFRDFCRGVAAPSAEAQRRASARLTSALAEATGSEQRTQARRSGRRRLVVLAAAVLVVVVGAASAFATVEVLFGDGSPHIGRTFFVSEGKRGSFAVRLLISRPNSPISFEEVRTWRIVPEPEGSAAPTTGQYVQVTGRGRVVRIGGRAQEWHARLEGFVTRPGEAKQRVVITMKGRPEGVFVLAPLQPGILKRDSGTQTYTGATG